MIEALDVDLFAETVTALVTVPQALVLFRTHRVVAIQVDVASHADVLDRSQANHMIDVIEIMLDGRRLLCADEHAYARNAHHAAGRSHLLYSFVRLTPRMARHERPAVR